MRLRFWRQERDEHRRGGIGCHCEACRDAERECRHDWTNWTKPEPTVVQSVVSMFGSETVGREMLCQTRTCLKCNQFERRYC